MDLELFVTPGLGDASYLLASGREAVLVDPQRDAWRFLEVAERRGWRVRHVLETHVHNDYLSGALETRAATGAEIAAPARGGYAFEHRPMDEGDAIEIGSLRLTAWATPGHTPEHLAWAVEDLAAADPAAVTGPVAVFTGGSLIVGSAGRTDLLGPALTNALTSDQQRSLRRLAELPDAVEILPTHGAGSFCSAGPAAPRRVSTIGAERFANPTFALASGPAGRLPRPGPRRPRPVSRLLRAHGRAQPARPARPRPADPPAGAGSRSLRGRGPRPRPRPRSWTPAIAEAFAAGHLPGSLNIELDVDVRRVRRLARAVRCAGPVRAPG